MGTLRSEIDQAIKSYRSQGYCTSMGEIRRGNHSISVMLNLPHLGRRMTLSCGGPADQLPERVLHHRVAPLLMQSAAAIERLSAGLAH
jgi:DNA-binding IclR family transcriptional regulator